jgi:hypothetical protein
VNFTDPAVGLSHFAMSCARSPASLATRSSAVILVSVSVSLPQIARALDSRSISVISCASLAAWAV